MSMVCTSLFRTSDYLKSKQLLMQTILWLLLLPIERLFGIIIRT